MESDAVTDDVVDADVWELFDADAQGDEDVEDARLPVAITERVGSLDGSVVVRVVDVGESQNVAEASLVRELVGTETALSVATRDAAPESDALALGREDAELLADDDGLKRALTDAETLVVPDRDEDKLLVTDEVKLAQSEWLGSDVTDSVTEADGDELTRPEGDAAVEADGEYEDDRDSRALMLAEEQADDDLERAPLSLGHDDGDVSLDGSVVCRELADTEPVPVADALEELDTVREEMPLTVTVSDERPVAAALSLAFDVTELLAKAVGVASELIEDVAEDAAVAEAIEAEALADSRTDSDVSDVALTLALALHDGCAYRPSIAQRQEQGVGKIEPFGQKFPIGQIVGTAVL